MNFTEEQIQHIEDMAGLGYGFEMIAMYLNIDKNMIKTEFEDENSEFRQHFERGKLVSDVDIEKKLIGLSKEGNIDAIQELNKIKFYRSVENVKKEVKNESQ